MRCPECGPAAAGHGGDCVHCGAELVHDCPGCGATFPSRFRFCGKCGGRLAGVAAAGASSPDGPGGDTIELTILFCDLVGSTELSSRLDPEELRDIVRAYQRAAVNAVERQGGHVAQYLGDGILVYFGHPTARPDDPERAVDAGLGVCSAIAALGDDFDSGGVAIAVRVGLHTGPVVATEVGRTKEWLALGATPTIAAKVQDLAESGGLVVTDATQRALGGRFACDSLGRHELPGAASPVEVFRVTPAVGEPSQDALPPP